MFGTRQCGLKVLMPCMLSIVCGIFKTFFTDLLLNSKQLHQSWIYCIHYVLNTCIGYTLYTIINTVYNILSRLCELPELHPRGDKRIPICVVKWVWLSGFTVAVSTYGIRIIPRSWVRIPLCHRMVKSWEDWQNYPVSVLGGRLREPLEMSMTLGARPYVNISSSDRLPNHVPSHI